MRKIRAGLFLIIILVGYMALQSFSKERFDRFGIHGVRHLNIKMSESAPDVIVMDMAIQKRERDLAIATYGRGFFIADIQPFK
ncbi:MAG: hypothetical protein DRJ11_06285, partial [Candidatus Aminicenantes bacterium]